MSSITTLIVMLKRTANQDHDKCHDEGYCEGGDDGIGDKRIMIRTNERTIFFFNVFFYEGITSRISPDTVRFCCCLFFNFIICVQPSGKQ